MGLKVKGHTEVQGSIGLEGVYGVKGSYGVKGDQSALAKMLGRASEPKGRGVAWAEERRRKEAQ
jgi:hypothetical protein